MSKNSTPGVRQRHTTRCTRPATCRCPWEWQYESKADPNSGKRDQSSRGGYPTMRDAKTARATYVSDLPNRANADRRLTVGAWLTEWLEQRVNGAGKTIRPTTATSYLDHIERFLTPTLGKRVLRDLTAGDIEKAFATIRREHPNLSPASIGRCYATLRGALNAAAKSGRLAVNPCARTSLSSSAPAPKVRPWSGEELGSFLDRPQVQAHRLFPAIQLLAFTGLRRGEVCGLRWSDVDLAGGAVRVSRSRTVAAYKVVEGTAKSADGHRIVPLDPETVRVLSVWQLEQKRERWSWSDEHRGDADPYVFTAPDGAPIHPERVTRAFEQLVRATGMRQVRLHDLRHGLASNALNSGASVFEVSKLLGHANIAVTSDIYGHLDPRRGREAIGLAAASVPRSRPSATA